MEANLSDHDRAAPGSFPERRPWVAPTLEELPRLTELTLQSIPGGDIGGSESVFP